MDEWFLRNTLDKVGLKLRTMWLHPLNMCCPIDGEFVRESVFPLEEPGQILQVLPDVRAHIRLHPRWHQMSNHKTLP